MTPYLENSHTPPYTHHPHTPTPTHTHTQNIYFDPTPNDYLSFTKSYNERPLFSKFPGGHISATFILSLSPKGVVDGMKLP